MVPPIVYGAAALRGTRPRWPWRLLLGLAAGLGVLAIGVGGPDSVLPLAALGALVVLVVYRMALPHRVRRRGGPDVRAWSPWACSTSCPCGAPCSAASATRS